MISARPSLAPGERDLPPAGPQTLSPPLLTIDQLQSLLLGPGDLLLPPGRGPPRLAVLDQQV